MNLAVTALALTSSLAAGCTEAFDEPEAVGAERAARMNDAIAALYDDPTVAASGTPSGDCSGDCRRIDVNIVFLTDKDDPDHLGRAQVAANQVDLLNAHFRTLSGAQIFQFVKKRHVTFADAHSSPACPKLKRLARDAENDIGSNAIRNAAVDQCFDGTGEAARLFDHAAINMYIFDHVYTNDDEGSDGGTGYGKEVGNKRFPVLFVDIDRVSKARHGETAAAQEHELGHAFGLHHVCQPQGALHTSIMPTSNTMKLSWFDPAAPDDATFRCVDAGGAQGDRSMGFSDFTLSTASSSGNLAAVDQMATIQGNIAAVARALGTGMVSPAQPRF